MGELIKIDINEALALALYRALRGEVPPCVCAITADLSDRPIQLHIYSGVADCMESEDVIESEMEQCLPDGVDRSFAQINYTFHNPEDFGFGPGLRLLYRNPF